LRLCGNAIPEAAFLRADYHDPIVLLYFVETRSAIMQTQVGKWGNSLAVRIPGAFAKELELEEGAELEMIRVPDGLLLRPRKPEYTLDELLAQITPENLHGETDWGEAVGPEEKAPKDSNQSETSDVSFLPQSISIAFGCT
jgi:antitoxin MazE